MYAVIRTGGKQYRVEAGERLEVELVAGDVDAEVELAPVLVVDGDHVRATPRDLEGAVVRARIVGDARGPKIAGFVYKPKSNQRRRYGHRQRRSVLEITAIEPGGTARSGTAGRRAGADESAGEED